FIGTHDRISVRSSAATQTRPRRDASWILSARETEIVTLRPSTKPASVRPRWNASVRYRLPSAEPWIEDPNDRHRRLLRARRTRPPRHTAAEKCDEFPPPHGAYPKAKDHGLSIAPCIAARSGHLCPLWVISDVTNSGDESRYVRFASQSGHKLGAPVHVC